MRATCQVEDGSCVAFVIPAWTLPIEKHSDIQFVVHKSLDGFDHWAVSELTTGLKVPGTDEAESLEEAMLLGEFILNQKTPEQLAAILAKATMLPRNAGEATLQ